MTFARYAIYATMPEGPASKFCTSLLGWDSISAKTVPHPQIDTLPLPIEQLTQTPRKYGLHATIKPPFRLANGMSFEALVMTCQELCDSLASTQIDSLSLTRLGRFLALTPQGGTKELNRLAAEMVAALDGFRAPMTRDEMEKRRYPNMPPHLVSNLERWGYPHVMDAFKFHITLTGKMPSKQAEQTLEILKPMVDPMLPSPFPINSLSLMGEDASGMFHEIQRFPLAS